MIDTSTNTDHSRKSVVFENQLNRSLWTVNDVAEFLDVSPRTIRDWVYRRMIPFRKAGNALRFSPAEIEQWTLPNKE
jgi:excisionase family DNA binding protein